ncbi:MAG: hypothetical protein HRU36_02240 [Rickettsiales bacterium]|nr:hypothetical protein [Rickettsiales bacterium]
MIGAVASALLLSISGDLITSFICYELLTILTFPLIIATGSQKEIIAARKYILTLITCSLGLFLPAITIIYYFTGGIGYATGGTLETSSISPVLAIITFLMFMYGIAKTAIMPIHFWLPSAMAAPIPVSGLLHAVAVVKSGLLILVKIIVYIYGINYLNTLSNFFSSINLFTALCAVSVLFSAIIALYQSNIKKLLAYSTINHLSICVLSALMFSATGIKAAIIHMIGHAISKLSLFFASGILEAKYKITEIDDLKGFVNRSKTVAFIFTLATISMIGIPPLAGFIGKAYIFYAAIIEKIDYITLVILTISILLSVKYFTPLIYNIYFDKQNITSQTNKNLFEITIMKWATLLGCIGITFYVLLLLTLVKFLDKIQFVSS